MSSRRLGCFATACWRCFMGCSSRSNTKYTEKVRKERERDAERQRQTDLCVWVCECAGERDIDEQEVRVCVCVVLKELVLHPLCSSFSDISLFVSVLSLSRST